MKMHLIHLDICAPACSVYSLCLHISLAAQQQVGNGNEFMS